MLKYVFVVLLSIGVVGVIISDRFYTDAMAKSYQNGVEATQKVADAEKAELTKQLIAAKKEGVMFRRLAKALVIQDGGIRDADYFVCEGIDEISFLAEDVPGGETTCHGRGPLEVPQYHFKVTTTNGGFFNDIRIELPVSPVGVVPDEGA